MRLTRFHATVVMTISGLLLVGVLRPRTTLTGRCPEAFWIEKYLLDADYDVVLAGDSRTYRGLSPAVMQETLAGSRIANFGFSGNGFHPDYLAHAERLLDPDSMHPAIVLGLTPTSLVPRAVRNNEYLEIADQHPLSRLMQRCSTPLLHFFRPLDAVEIRQYWAAPETGYFQDYRADGWVASRKVPEDPGEALPRYRRAPQSEAVDPDIVADVLAAVRRWRAQGIRVYGFRPPASLDMENFENNHLGYDVADVSARFEQAGGVWLNFDNTAYHSYDGSHLRKDGAIKLSHDLAAALHEGPLRPVLVSSPIGSEKRKEKREKE